MSRIRDHLSFANVTSTMALFVALGGVGYAAATLPNNSVGTTQVTNDSLRGVDIRNNDIRGIDIRDKTITDRDIQVGSIGPREVAGLTAQDFVAGTLLAGVTGTQGPVGAQGPTGKDGASGKDGSPDTAAQVRDKLLTADGSGSGLDADKLDGKDSTEFASSSAEPWNFVGPGQAAGFDPGQSECHWRNFGSGNETAAFFRDNSGVVHLRGLVQADKGADGLCDINFPDRYILGLPAGYRPSANHVFSVLTNGQLGRVDVHPDGLVEALPPSTAANFQQWLSFAGISFRCEPSGADGCP